MTTATTAARIAILTRWIARVWTILLFLILVLIVVVPDPYMVEPVPISEWIELSFYGLAFVGLALAWRWEAPGGIIAITGIACNAMVFRIFRGTWFIQTIPVLVFGLPAVLYLSSWYLTRHKSDGSPLPEEYTQTGKSTP